MTAIELRDRIAAGQISSVDATRAVLDRISRIDPTIGAYLATFPNGACKHGSIV